MDRAALTAQLGAAGIGADAAARRPRDRRAARAPGGRVGAGRRARWSGGGSGAPPGGGRARRRWGSASSSRWTSRSCAAWRTTPAPCSSCSTPAGRFAPSAAAGATTACSRRSAASTCPRWASAWATWCSRSCSATAGWSRPTSRASTCSSPRSPRRTCPSCSSLAHELRDAGLRAEYALGTQAVGKQLKLADARNARFAVVIGPDDRARGEVMLKDLAGKGQEAVPRSQVVERLAPLPRVTRRGEVELRTRRS